MSLNWRSSLVSEQSAAPNSPAATDLMSLSHNLEIISKILAYIYTANNDHRGHHHVLVKQYASGPGPCDAVCPPRVPSISYLRCHGRLGARVIRFVLGLFFSLYSQALARPMTSFPEVSTTFKIISVNSLASFAYRGRGELHCLVLPCAFDPSCYASFWSPPRLRSYAPFGSKNGTVAYEVIVSINAGDGHGCVL